MPEYQRQVIEERDELSANLERLVQFTRTEEFTRLPELDVGLLEVQATQMGA